MIETTDQIFQIPENSLDDLTISGSGYKHLVVVVGTEHFGLEESATLKKMIEAIKYDFVNDIFLLQLHDNQNISFHNILPVYDDIILFGIKPSQIGIFVDCINYEILNFEKSRMLICDPIKDINAVQSKKVLLWNKLQEMFLK